MKRDRKIIGAGLLTATASSLCCITPVLALISGTSGIATTFSWIAPFRPYLIGITLIVLVFAWYQLLKPKKEIDCDCETEEKKSFLQSKLFLGIVTLFAMVMLAFPYYSSLFLQQAEKEIMIVDRANIQSITINIKGMTCTACEETIHYAVNQLDGILKVNASYDHGNAEIEFDHSKTSLENIEEAVNSTGYKVIQK